MGPGQPGIALGGLFYLLLALLGPVVEATRAIRGRSTAASRRLVARHFALAASMLIALDLSYRAVAALFGSSSGGTIALPAGPLLLGLALLALVIVATKLADLGLRRTPRRRERRIKPRPIEATD